MVEILLVPVAVLVGVVVPVFRALVIACYDGMGRDQGRP
jgi:hypothetical protein